MNIRKPPVNGQVVFFWEEGLPGGEPDNPCMKKSIVGGSEVVLLIGITIYGKFRQSMSEL